MLAPRGQRSAAAFSLVEVTLAIGIIAFAFVALFGLLPTGMQTFRAAIDISNESWILQNINSMVQTTDFAQIENLGFKKSGEIFYFDEEAKLTDTEKHPGNAAAKLARLYAVKLVTDNMHRPSPRDRRSSTSRLWFTSAIWSPPCAGYTAPSSLIGLAAAVLPGRNAPT